MLYSTSGMILLFVRLKHYQLKLIIPTNQITCMVHLSYLHENVSRNATSPQSKLHIIVMHTVNLANKMVIADINHRAVKIPFILFVFYAKSVQLCVKSLYLRP